MRQVFMDIRTDGVLPERGARVIEIACIEALDGQATGQFFHRFLDPGYALPADVLARLGYEGEVVQNAPPFAGIADELVAFLSGAEIRVHNPRFHDRFLHAELQACGREAAYFAIKERLLDAVQWVKSDREGGLTIEDLAERCGVELKDIARLSAALRGALLLIRLYARLT